MSCVARCLKTSLLPDGLPVPKDDGAADHLQRMTMCDVSPSDQRHDG